MMKYKEYKLLKGLYQLAPVMNGEQKYEIHWTDDMPKSTGFPLEDALAIAADLEELGYIELFKNKADAKERPGYIHLVRITYRGVLAMKEYPKDVLLSALRNIIVPALVSLAVSAACTALGFN